MSSATESRNWLAGSVTSSRAQVVLVIILSLAGKFLGFLRIQQIAVILGSSSEADTLLLVLQLLWLVESLLVAGAVVPIIIANIYKIDRDLGYLGAVSFYSHFAITCILLSLVWLVVLVAGFEFVISSLAPGFGYHEKTASLRLIQLSAGIPILLTIVHFACLINRLGENIFWYSVPQVVINSFGILGLVYGNRFFPFDPAESLLIASTLALVATLVLQVIVIPRNQLLDLTKFYRIERLHGFLSGVNISYWIPVGFLILVNAVNEAYIFIDFSFASRFGDGTLSLVAYASRLASIVNMVLVSSLFVVFEPRWSAAFANMPKRTWLKLAATDINQILLMVILASGLLFAFPQEINALVYFGSEFRGNDLEKFSDLTRAYALVCFLLALSFILGRLLILAGLQRQLFYSALVALPVKLVSIIFFVDWVGIEALPLSSSLALAVQAGVGTIFLGRSQIVISVGRSADFSFFCCLLVLASCLALVECANWVEGHLSLIFFSAVIGAVTFSAGVFLRVINLSEYISRFGR